jgi:HTH-type transcriptional regulator/antitoxin HipB
MKITSARDLGALVRDSRHKRGLSQEDLARQVGVSRQWIIGLEHGRAREVALVFRTLASLGLAIDIVSDADQSGRPKRRHVDLDQLLSRVVGQDRQ